MQQDRPLRRLDNALTALAVYLIIFLIFLVGLRYAYYSIFSEFRPYDDEGTMMLRVLMLIKEPAAYDSVAGLYGPFYYLHKYALHGWLNLPVTHDVNRLTTIVLWGLIAATSAIFVYRLSRSIVLAAVVQMQLILHLHRLVYEPGHPQEIVLLLVSTALVASSFATDRRGALPSMMALGAATGALLLVKVNLGICLAASVALAILFSLPRTALVIGLAWASAVAGLMLPAALMWRHLDTAWGRNYCALVTLVIGASLVATARSAEGGWLRWRDVAVTAAATVLTVVSVCTVILAWGNPLAAIVNSIFLRAANFSSTFVVRAPIPDAVVIASLGSLLLAMCYAFATRRIQEHEGSRLVLACIKLWYGCFAFYGFYQFGPDLLQQTIPVPFLWLVVARTDGGALGHRHFPRMLLCLLAAFLTLQAYPVYGAQRAWAVFLVAPLAAICFADGLNTILEIARRHLQWDAGQHLPQWLRASLAGLLLVFAGTTYYRKADVAGQQAAYWRNEPLSLPGASKLRLTRPDVARIRWLTENVSAYCDGFVGMPGFGSLYFWTQIAPPAAINGAWILQLEDAYQRAIVEKMRTYARPCIVYHPKGVRFWLKGGHLDNRQPLVRYIQENFKPGPRFGDYTLLLGSKGSRTPPGRARAADEPANAVNRGRNASVPHPGG